MARRRRNYKAEYARRIANAAKAGKSRQAARGHKPKEHVERKRRAIAKHGVTPYQLTKLRRAARAKVTAIWMKFSRNPVSDRTIRRGMAMLAVEDLERLVEMDEVDVRSAVNIRDAYLYQLGEYFPASIDTIEAAETNPLWYHR